MKRLVNRSRLPAWPLILLVGSWSCTTYVTRPTSAISSEHPEVVRVRVRGGEIVPVAFPTLTADSLVGETFTSPRELRRHRTRVAIAREEIVNVMVERVSLSHTLVGFGAALGGIFLIILVACETGTCT